MNQIIASFKVGYDSVKQLKQFIQRLFVNQHIACKEHALPQIDIEMSIQPEHISQRDMVSHLLKIPCWQKKIEFYKEYQYSERNGMWLNRRYEQSSKDLNDAESSVHDKAFAVLRNIHYGCGGNLMNGWLNVDLHSSDASNYQRINIVEKHPFPDNTFTYAYAEDVLEHLSQAESIFFLSEIYRTLAVEGVVRLSFPGLEGVLRRHYSPFSERRVREGEFEAYSFWDHVHFYSQEEIRLVARHIGFRHIEFVEYGTSRHSVLCSLDTRSEQIDLNIIVELTK